MAAGTATPVFRMTQCDVFSNLTNLELAKRRAGEEQASDTSYVRHT
jgi:hypothetical protein